MGRMQVLAFILGISMLFSSSDASRSSLSRSQMEEGKQEEKTVTQKDSSRPGQNQNNNGSVSTEKPPPALPPPPPPSTLPPPSQPPSSDKAKPESPINAPPPSVVDPGSLSTKNPINLSPLPSEQGGKDAKGSKSGEGGKAGGEDPKGSQKGSTGAAKEVQENCDGLPKCQHDNLTACLQYPEKEPMESFVLVQNIGENVLDGNINAPSSVTIDQKKFSLNKHQSTKILFATSARESVDIVVRTEKGECILHTTVAWNLSDQIAAYTTYFTPVYGAYFLFITVLIVGGTWACCKFGRKKKRTDAGIPYQQLEMGARHDSTPAVDPNTTVGWDEGWDDDWGDEEAASRPPEKHLAENASMNGHAPRTVNREGWDVDWDD